ncbi:MAG: hypothetical protein PGN07_05120 [Aeromicrobium erythreum]
MKLRMIIATSVVAALASLAACGTDDQPEAAPSSEPTSAAPSSEATSAAPSGVPTKASDLVGTWEDKAAKWEVRFKADGSYTMDYEGVKDFMSGTYSLSGETVSLSNDEGTDQGQVQGESLVFKLGTLTRK